jgi:DNA-directed RNA polymerase alpha subunit
MDEKRMPKRFWKSTLKNPTKRWVNVKEMESREILKVRNCKRESLDKQVQRLHLNEAKVRCRAVAS